MLGQCLVNAFRTFVTSSNGSLTIVSDCAGWSLGEAENKRICQIFGLKSAHGRLRNLISEESFRLFTVLYFSIRSSRLSDLCYRLPSCMSVKTT